MSDFAPGSHDPKTAAVNAVEAGEGGWRPIETAPKDGTIILATNPSRGHLGLVVRLGSEWEAITFECFGTGTGFYPTHWMPLPAPPAKER